MSNNQTQNFDLWCIVELFGHTKIAGRCTEQSIAGTSMLRVDVPETKTQQGFTRFLNHAAIYAINPVTEEYARLKADHLQVKPIESWDIREFQKRLEISRGNLPATREIEFEEDEN